MAVKAISPWLLATTCEAAVSKGLVMALQALKTNQKLPCAVIFEPTGLSIRFLDSGHVMQSGISLSASVFSHFQAPATLTLFVPLNVLLDSINTVASSMPHELHLHFPGPDDSLLLTTTEDAGTRTSICSYAQIATLAQHDMSSLDDMWDPHDVCSQVILSGMMLREAIDDLEWTGGEVEFVMRRSPMHFSLQSIKQQSLEITFPTHALDGFSCHAEEVRASFQYKHLKAAFTNVAQKEAWSVKIAISSRGMLRVTHMLALAGASTAMPPTAQPMLGSLTSQGHAQRTCVATFVIAQCVPHEEEEFGNGNQVH